MTGFPPEGIKIGTGLGRTFKADEDGLMALMRLGRVMGDEPYGAIESVQLVPPSVRQRGPLDGYTGWLADRLFLH